MMKRGKDAAEGTTFNNTKIIYVCRDFTGTEVLVPMDQLAPRYGVCMDMCLH